MLTEFQRNFIGTTFPTGFDSNLTVTGVTGRKVGSQCEFILECSKCSLDTELWPYGSITSIKSRLVRGSFPCCTSSPKWTEIQYKIRTIRYCNSIGVAFKGWSGEFKGKRTKLLLYSKYANKSWDSSSITNFVGKGRDPFVVMDSLPETFEKKDEYYLGLVSEDYKSKVYNLKRSTKLSGKGHKIYWEYCCHVCSVDDFVKLGLCDGKFTTTTACLLREGLTCRCSKVFSYSKEQATYRISNILKMEGHKFVKWRDGYIGCKSFIVWVCVNGHTRVTDLSNFLQGNRCRVCSNIEVRSYGHYPTRVEEMDYLYIIYIKSQDIFKIGRSFNIKQRFKSIAYSSQVNINELEVFKVLTGKHQQVYDYEQELHADLSKEGYHSPNTSWTQEAFKGDCKDSLIRLLFKSPLKTVDENLLLT